MTYSLAVANGDLVQRGSSLAIVYGISKLQQDLSLWVTERHRIDRFHPMMGSALPDYIGSLITDSTRMQVKNELLRILGNYQDVQFQALRERPQNFSYSELLYSIDGVEVSLSFDTVYATVSFRNAEGVPSAIAVNQGV